MTDDLDGTICLIVDEQHAGQRLDQYLSSQFPDHSRSMVTRWISQGDVTVAGAAVRSSRRLKTDEQVSVAIPAPVASVLVPEHRDLEVLHEDDQILVLIKPPDLVVHPGAGVTEGTLVHALLARGDRWSTIGGVHRPGIVHRLDRTTSGVMVVARTDAAHRSLSEQFSQRQVGKQYRAVVHQHPQAVRGLIDAPIGRHATHRARMAVRDDGRAARTRYRIVARYLDFSQLKIQLLTGRTHQIRVHLSEMGHPIVGDRLYGAPSLPQEHPQAEAVAAFGRIALHAEVLEFMHPESGEALSFTAPLPDDFATLLEMLSRPVP